MYQKVFLILAALTIAQAKPTIVAAAYTGVPVTAPVAFTASGFVTATSSQYVTRNYNGVYAAPYVAAATAPLVTSAAYSYVPPYVL